MFIACNFLYFPFLLSCILYSPPFIGIVYFIHKENHQCVCEVCGESYSSHPALIRHLKTHHGPKSHQCETCGKAFHRKCVLNAHKRVHSGLCAFFVASLLIYLFYRMKYFKRKLLLLPGEKPFHCATCGLKFSQKSSLQRHDKVHSKLK